MSPRPCLEPTSPSGPGANPPTSGFGSTPPLGPEGRARAQAAKPEGMFGRQSADAALGREQTEAVCLGVICSFSEDPRPGAPERAERRQGGQAGGAQAGGLSGGPRGGTPSSAPPTGWAGGGAQAGGLSGGPRAGTPAQLLRQGGQAGSAQAGGLSGGPRGGTPSSAPLTGWAGRLCSGWGSVPWTPGWDPQLSSSARLTAPVFPSCQGVPAGMLPGCPSWHVKGTLGSQGAAEGTCGRGGGYCSLMARSPPEPFGLNSSTPPGKGGLRLGVLTSSPCKCPLSLPSHTPSCFPNVKPGFLYVGRTRNTCGAARTART